MEAKTTLARRQDAVQSDFMRKMLTNAGCLLCGILVSRGAVLGSLAPFGASFAAAVPRKYLLSSLLGTAFGDNAASLTYGEEGIMHGFNSIMLKDENGKPGAANTLFSSIFASERVIADDSL